jgi:hypothetical protein
MRARSRTETPGTLNPSLPFMASAVAGREAAESGKGEGAGMWWATVAASGGAEVGAGAPCGGDMEVPRRGGAMALAVWWPGNGAGAARKVRGGVEPAAAPDCDWPRRAELAVGGQ